MKRKLMCTTIAVAFFAAGPHASAGEESHGSAHWGYKGAQGSDHWGDMKPDYALCKTGKAQSPIDIRGAAKADLAPLAFDYKDGPLKVVDNGHTVQVNVAPGSYLTANGDRYELVQFHFHKPSEEMVNGKRYDMVAHLVHKNRQGDLAVVAVLFTQGSDNGFINTVWDNVPREVGEEATVEGSRINVGKLLPRSRGFYTFAGSLTTPPCSEGVTWFVLKTPVQASAAQVARFGKLYDNNARTVQPLNGRVVKSGG